MASNTIQQGARVSTGQDLQRKDIDLYVNGEFIQLPDGDQLLIREPIQYESREPDQYHTVQQGDTLTYLAWYYYRSFTSRSPRYWKYIADANLIHNPLDLTEYIGKDIVIPKFDLIRLKEL